MESLVWRSSLPSRYGLRRTKHHPNRGRLVLVGVYNAVCSEYKTEILVNACGLAWTLNSSNGSKYTAKLSSQLEAAVRGYRQWFGSYKASVELKRIQVWLTLKDGCIEFLTPADSYKVKRVLRNPHVVCFLGTENGPAFSGMAEIVVDPDSLCRVYRAYGRHIDNDGCPLSKHPETD